jgi:hypothetical protein
MKAEPQKEHKWLEKLVGEWTYESEMSAEPDKPPEKLTGTETVRSVGGLWVVAEGRGEMPGGGTAIMLVTLGYDPQKKQFVGTWVGSMMTHMWIYNGTLDESERVLTLNSEGPDFSAEGKTAKFKDVIELQGDDRRTLKGHMMGADGAWMHLVTMNYRRAT